MEKIPLQNTGVSELIRDFLDEKPELREFYTAKVSPENLLKQAKIKLNKYKNREAIVEVLSKQNQNPTTAQKKSLESLKDSNSVTITTGHQLNLATGPLYFIYKILHTVKMCNEMNDKQSEIKFIPIYWMATEDHDFEEINHFNIYDRTFRWEEKNGGFVGDIKTEKLQSVFSEFFKELEKNTFSEKLKAIIEKAYNKDNLAIATRELVQQILGETGVLILDANELSLKEIMKPFFKKELKSQISSQMVARANKKLEKYGIQAFAREINLFLLEKGNRERIAFDSKKYFLANSFREFTEQEIEKELDENPEKFSPNVILRPLYQEVVLPNVCYVGGAGEIAYWLQLKNNFEYFGVDFPLLMVRNSLLIMTKNQLEKAKKFNILLDNLFNPIHELKKEWIRQQSDLFLQLEKLKKELENQFYKVAEIADKTHSSFKQMLLAQSKRQANGFEKMEKRLQKAERKRLKEKIARLDELHSFMFPNGTWQERKINFSYFYQKHGDLFFKEVYDSITPFESNFIIKTFDY